jgi:adenylate cyclase
MKTVDTVTVSIPAADIKAELDRILASKGFATAGRLSRLIRYVVEKTLAGEADQLKEYAVGVEVFDRDDKYDPRLDSIVRVEAGRLRSRLDEYYNGEGAASPIRINLPRGGYVAQFETREATPAAAPEPMPVAAQKGRGWAAWPLTAGLICAVAAMVVWLGGWNRTPPKTGPAITVLAFGHTRLPAEDASLAERLTESVTTELARLGTVGVSSHTSAIQFSRAPKPLREIAAALNTSFILEASVEREPNGLLVTTRIVNAETDRKIWVADYRGAADDVRGISQRIAFDVSAELLRLSRP